MTLEKISRCLWRTVVGVPAAAGVGVFLASMPPTYSNAADVVRSQEIAEGLTKGFRVTLPAIQFEFDSDRLTDTARKQLVELVRALGAGSLKSRSFAIQGHTDSTGSDKYNRNLSLKRSRAVKRHIVRKMGIAPERLVDVGFGESVPIRGIPAEDGRNRRVEIVNLGAMAPPGTSGKRALLIGVDAYRDVGSLLGAPVNDATEMRAFLVRHLGYRDHDIKVLLDDEATRSNILAGIDDWLIGGTNAGGEAFLFFSGHGFQQPDVTGDELDGRDETLVPVDTSVTGNGELVGMITDDEVAVRVDRLAGRRVHIVLDSCHSGTGTKSAGDPRYVKSPRLPDGTPPRVAESKGISRITESRERESFLSSNNSDVTVWTASKADQRALVDRDAPEGDRGSVFTRLFLRGVSEGKADFDADGTVTVRELRKYLVDGSGSYCERHPADCTLGLTPQLSAVSGRLDEAVFVEGGPAHLSSTALFAKDLLVERRPMRRELGQVRLEIRPGSKVAVGDEIEVVVESDRAGNLVLLDVDAAGRLVQIFPNHLSVQSGVPERIRAGERVSLPGRQSGFRFQATTPVGRGVLIAVVSDKSPPLQKLASRHKDLAVISRPEAYLVELSEVLRAAGVQPAAGPGTGNTWTVGKTEYEIVSRGR